MPVHHNVPQLFTTSTTITAILAVATQTSGPLADPTSTNHAVPSGNPTSPVAWQSAFWAIVLIALNNMAQEGGDTCHLPKQYNPSIRSSPFLCCLDCLETLVRISVNCYNLRSSLHEAICKEASRRRQPCRTANSNDDASSGNWQLKFLGWITLALAIWQCIKVMAWTGLPWTQAFSLMYLVSYLVETNINYFGRLAADDLSATNADIEDLYNSGVLGLGLTLQLGFWIWVTQHLIPTKYAHSSVTFTTFESGYKYHSTPYEGELFDFSPLGIIVAFITCIVGFVPYLIGVLLICTAPMALVIADLVLIAAPAIFICYLIKLLDRKLGYVVHTFVNQLLGVPDRYSTSASIIQLCALAFAISGLQCYLIGTWHAVLLIPGLIPFEYFMEVTNYGVWVLSRAIRSFIYLMLILGAFYVVFRVLFFGSLARKLPFVSRHSPDSSVFMLTAFFLLNLGTCFIYYSRIYNGTETNVPAWTSRLPRML